MPTEGQGFYIESGTVTEIPDGGSLVLDILSEADVVLDTAPVAVQNGQYVIDLPQSRSSNWPNRSKFRLTATPPGAPPTSVFVEIGESSILHRIGTSNTVPAFTSPVSGTTLSGSTQTFTWTSAGAARYDLWINGVDQGPSVTGLSWEVTGLPTDGSTINVELRYSYDDFATQETPVTATFTAFTADNDCIPWIPSNSPVSDSRDNTEYGSFVGVAGVPLPPSGNTEFTKVEFRPNGTPAIAGGTSNGHFGSDRRININGTEAWLSYYIFIGNDLNASQALKLIGFSSQTTGGANGGQGNLGGGGDQAYSARGTLAQPGTSFPEGAGFTIYHDNSPTAPQADPEWWGNNTPNETSPQTEAELRDGAWHRCIQYIKLNTIGQNDGILRAWLDVDTPTVANAIYNRTNFGFTDNPALHNIRIWFDNFHGGTGEIAQVGTIFYDDIYYCEGAMFDGVSSNTSFSVTPVAGSTLSAVTQQIVINGIPDTHHWDVKIFSTEAQADAFIAGTSTAGQLYGLSPQDPATSHEVSAAGLSDDGSTIAMVVSWYMFDGTNYSDVNRQKVLYTAYSEPASDITPAPGTTLTSTSQQFTVENIIPDGTHHWDIKMFDTEANADIFINTGAQNGVVSSTPITDPSTTHQATLTGLESDGSQSALVVSWYVFDGTTYSDVNRVKYLYTAHTSTTTGTTSHNYMQGMGTATALPAARQVVGSEQVVSGLSNTVYENKHFFYNGPSGDASDTQERRVLGFYNCHNLTVRGVIAMVEDDSRYIYFRYSAGNRALMCIYIHSDCTNITIERCNTYRGIVGIQDHGKGTHIVDNAIGGYLRLGILGFQVNPSASRDFRYASNIMWTPFHTESGQNSSVDNINVYSWEEAAHDMHLVEDNVIFGGGGGPSGGNGSAIVLDGPDPGTHHSGKVRVRRNVTFDSANKWIGIASGRGNIVEDNDHRQSSTSPCITSSGGQIAAYIFDYKDSLGSTIVAPRLEKQRDFTNNKMINNRIHHYTSGNQGDRIAPVHPLVSSDNAYSFGHPNTGNDLTTGNDYAHPQTRASLMIKAQTRVGHVPVYEIPGEENMYWANLPE